MREWLVFLCYRQIDGGKIAQWLHRILAGQQLRGLSEPLEESKTLTVYLDVAAPAVSDWHQFHGRALERARAFLVICTPGARFPLDTDDGVHKEDWVHKEINWWLDNRKTTAPILIDATGEAQRWVPDRIRQRWPNAQLVKVDLETWDALPQSEREALLTITRERILDGIRASERSVSLEDLNKNMARAFVERAERAVADGEELIADILLAHAFEIDRSADIRDHLMAHIYLKFGDALGAKPFLERLLANHQQQARKYLTRPATVDRLVLASTTRAALDSWLILTATLGEHAYESVLSSKGLVGRASLVERRIWRQIGREEPEVFQTFQAARQNLSDLHIEPGVSNGNARYDTVIDALLEARTALNARAARYEAAYEPWLLANLSDLQSRLTPSEVILDFLRYANRYAVWIVRRQGVNRIELGPAGPIDSLLRDCRGQLERADGDYLAAGRRLFDLIWAPMETQLSDAEFLYVVPDGDLTDFPLSALPNSRDESFVIDRWKLAYLLTPRQILPWPQSAPRSEGALVVGVSETVQDLHDGKDLHRLPFAEMEAQAISSLYAASILVGERATAGALRNGVVGKRLLHIAAHHLRLQPVDMRSVLLGVSLNPARQIHKLVEGSDPLLKSGVALYDRILTALELSDLDLDGVDIAVLSMQQEGMIAWSGEGTFGLPRALVEAGARTVVFMSSLVDDRTTLEYMMEFHRKILSGVSVVDAVRQATLTIRAAYPDPYYWAHFAVVGQVEPLQP
jgi:CHAT domain-containing protein